MRRHTRSLAASVAVLVLAATASAASANRLTLSSTDVRITWPSLTFGGEGGGLTCPVTMSGSFHSSSLTKSNGSLIGQVTSAAAGRCETADNHSMVFLDETLPWHIRYDGFGGTLPAILRLVIRLTGVAVRVVAGIGIPCLFTTETLEPLRTYWNVDPRTGQLEESFFEETNEIDLDDGEFFCALGGDGTFEGAAVITSTRGQLIFLRLI